MWSLKQKQTRQDKQVRTGCLSNSSRPWGHGDCPRVSGAWPRTAQGGEACSVRAGEGMRPDSGLMGLHLQSAPVVMVMGEARSQGKRTQACPTAVPAQVCPALAGRADVTASSSQKREARATTVHAPLEERRAGWWGSGWGLERRAETALGLGPPTGSWVGPNANPSAWLC